MHSCAHTTGYTPVLPLLGVWHTRVATTSGDHCVRTPLLVLNALPPPFCYKQSEEMYLLTQTPCVDGRKTKDLSTSSEIETEVDAPLSTAH